MMNSEIVEIVQQSFAKVAPIADTAAQLFYKRLFEIAPQLRPMFSEDLTEQRVKLMRSLALAVNGLSNADKVLPALQHLGRKHVQYGVTDEHYDIVGEALIWTLEQGLGDAFTPRVRNAWLVTYGTIAEVMKTAAAQATPQAEAHVHSILDRRAAKPARTNLPVETTVPVYETPEFQAWLHEAAYGH